MDLDDQETILHNFISSGIAKMLRMHHAHRACWYHIQHIPGSSRNLSSYIVMLMEFGLVREGRRIHLILHTISAWENVRVVHGLPENTERRKCRQKGMKGMTMMKQLGKFSGP